MNKDGGGGELLEKLRSLEQEAQSLEQSVEQDQPKEEVLSKTQLTKLKMLELEGKLGSSRRRIRKKGGGKGSSGPTVENEDT